MRACRNKEDAFAREKYLKSGYGKKFAGKYLDERKTIKIEKADTPKQAVELLLSILDNKKVIK